MDDTTKIPPLVLAQVRRHVVETEIRYETAVTAHAAQPVPTTTSRRLRAVRDQLAEELAAWRYLEEVASRSARTLGELRALLTGDGAPDTCPAALHAGGFARRMCELPADHAGHHSNGGTEWP